MVWCLIESRRKTSEHRDKDLILSVLRYCLSYGSHNRMVAKNHYQKRKTTFVFEHFSGWKCKKRSSFEERFDNDINQWKNSVQLNLFDKVCMISVETFQHLHLKKICNFCYIIYNLCYNWSIRFWYVSQLQLLVNFHQYPTIPLRNECGLLYASLLMHKIIFMFWIH